MLDHKCTKAMCAELIIEGKTWSPRGHAQERNAIFIMALSFCFVIFSFHKISNILCFYLMIYVHISHI